MLFAEQGLFNCAAKNVAHDQVALLNLGRVGRWHAQNMVTHGTHGAVAVAGEANGNQPKFFGRLQGLENIG